MARRLVPGLLVFAALLSDVGGNHGLSLAFLFFGIPAAFLPVLDSYGVLL